jgi:hypothetical protein
MQPPTPCAKATRIPSFLLPRSRYPVPADMRALRALKASTHELPKIVR